MIDLQCLVLILDSWKHNMIAEVLSGEMFLRSVYSNLHSQTRIYQKYFTGHGGISQAQ